jgi:hypothetical protein
MPVRVARMSITACKAEESLANPAASQTSRSAQPKTLAGTEVAVVVLDSVIVVVLVSVVEV